MCVNECTSCQLVVQVSLQVCVHVTFTVCTLHRKHESLSLSLSLSESLVSVSEFIPRSSSCRRRRVSGDAVLCHRADATLLGRLAGMLPVPVCGHGFVVPDCGGLRVADVAWLSGVVGGVDEQRLHGEGLQVPRLKVRHVLSAEEEKGRVKGDVMNPGSYLMLIMTHE